MRTTHVLISALVCLSLAACQDKPKPPEKKAAAPEPPAVTATAKAAPARPSATAAATAPPAPIPAESTKLFAERCALCHGKGGMGDGIGGKGMKPPPRNFTDATWQGSVNDEHLKTIILKGGVAVGKSATMPPNPDLEGKTEVVDGLMRIVRSLKGTSTPNK